MCIYVHCNKLFEYKPHSLFTASSLDGSFYGAWYSDICIKTSSELFGSKICLLSVVVVNFPHFHLLWNHWANFNWTWHKASLDKEDDWRKSDNREMSYKIFSRTIEPEEKKLYERFFILWRLKFSNHEGSWG